ncbi:helix-turn-helix transcriptional regulator [Enterococcus faecium]|uniref:HTH cro/C1-type domain-containing protein n=2 Tax=Enterococcus faecium TaxID=1352 RepID=A0AB73NTN6_ENTFC|nr:helix-turn-helix transcriptional regulator [Enterococcus faecium]EGP4986058.1 helix-turn-helix transcriptional regulator [Enterococcus faecium]EGP5129546.1 XRE family transcriptional regulator [Enterococcus faecium]EME3504188.1 helix-turn-helix transcriptional regulator [Enterococcus faecium]EME3512108.1 helix-turn-helix transcriptional regulator [Enterococcus faecium]EME3544418.1 helix-turn-helix transcriptional regulator [Enterococcus faecium]
MTSLPERLLEMRNALNQTQTDIAKGSNLSLRQYQRIENNESEPKLTALIALADYFDVSLDYLVGRSDEK